MIKSDIKRIKISLENDKLVAIIPNQLAVHETSKELKKSIHKWYKAEAEDLLGAKLFKYSRRIGVDPQKVSIRTQKRLWGNCDYNKKSITLNWQLIMAPIDVIDYVIIHELCHLVHPNHSQRFWKKVEKFLPDYKLQKKWLKDNHKRMDFS